MDRMKKRAVSNDLKFYSRFIFEIALLNPNALNKNKETSSKADLQSNNSRVNTNKKKGKSQFHHNSMPKHNNFKINPLSASEVKLAAPNKVSVKRGTMKNASRQQKQVREPTPEWKVKRNMELLEKYAHRFGVAGDVFFKGMMFTTKQPHTKDEFKQAIYSTFKYKFVSHLVKTMKIPKGYRKGGSAKRLVQMKLIYISDTRDIARQRSHRNFKVDKLEMDMSYLLNKFIVKRLPKFERKPDESKTPLIKQITREYISFTGTKIKF